jgi:hypothetical protein
VRISQSTVATREHTRWLGTAAMERLDPNDPNADPNDPNAWSDRRYLHGDLIDSTGLLTDDGATAVSSVFYTAFGEILDPASGSPLTGDSGAAGAAGRLPAGHPRFAYAGGWGYESPAGDDCECNKGDVFLAGVNPGLPRLTFQHVGHRWYQPDIGRFVQRDPIGIDGGLNVYTYTHGRPTTMIDPLGLESVAQGPLWTRIFLNWTGGRHCWLDDEKIVNHVVIAAAAAPAGVACAAVAPVTVFWCSVGWGVYRWTGQGTGSDIADAVLDGAAVGGGLVGGPRLPGPLRPPPKQGVLGGFPKGSNPPYIRP